MPVSCPLIPPKRGQPLAECTVHWMAIKVQPCYSLHNPVMSTHDRACCQGRLQCCTHLQDDATSSQESSLHTLMQWAGSSVQRLSSRLLSNGNPAPESATSVPHSAVWVPPVLCISHLGVVRPSSMLPDGCSVNPCRPFMTNGAASYV